MEWYMFGPYPFFLFISFFYLFIDFCIPILLFLFIYIFFENFVEPKNYELCMRKGCRWERGGDHAYARVKAC